MIIDIYRSEVQKARYLVVPSNAMVAGKSLGIVDADFVSISPLAIGIELKDGFGGMDINEATREIAGKGYYIFGQRIVVEVDIKNI